MERERMAPRLSIIIPVYNVEAFLRNTLVSVFSTNVCTDAFEVIVVDDGSLDGSAEIVREFCDHPNLVLLEEENSGPGGARMIGVSEATGDYLWFIDGDDYLVDNAIGKVLELLDEKPDADVLMFPLIRVSADSENRSLDYSIERDKLLEGKEIIMDPGLPVWNVAHFVLKRQMMDNPWASFPKRLIHEDEYFNVVLLSISERVWVMKDPVYVHLSRPGSIMDSLTSRSLEDMLVIHQMLNRFMKEVLDPSDWAWFRAYTFGQLKVSYDRLPHVGFSKVGFYLWRNWKVAYPGSSWKRRVKFFFYFLMPEAFVLLDRLVTKLSG